MSSHDPVVKLVFESSLGFAQWWRMMPLLMFADLAGIPDDQEPDKESATRVANADALRDMAISELVGSDTAPLLKGHWSCFNSASSPAFVSEAKKPDGSVIRIQHPRAWLFRFKFNPEPEDGE